MAKKSAAERIVTALTEVAEAVESGNPAIHPSVTVREVEVKDPPKYSGSRVARLRRRIGLSQTAFALVVGSSPVTVQKWEQGKLTPNPMARRLLSMLEVSPERATSGIVIRKTKRGRAKKRQPA